MKKVIFLVVLTIAVMLGFGQSRFNNYTLTLDFAPSFMGSSKLIVKVKGDSCFVMLHFYDRTKRDKAPAEDSAVVCNINKQAALADALRNYKFRTTGVEGFDGITVAGVFDQSNVSNKFGFWSPNKGTDNSNLILLVFDLITEAFANQTSINYLEQLEQYFPHKLGLKKLSDQPLTYKLFGWITSNEAAELDDFLQHLPLHRKVIVDMSNFSGMGTMFYDVFEDYCVGKREVYWLNPTLSGLVNLYKIGIPNTRIISQKKIAEIKKINGRDVISYIDE